MSAMSTTANRSGRIVSTCRYCRTARILWARTVNNRPMAVDVRPSETGNVQITRDREGIYADVLGHGDAQVLRDRGTQLYTPHVATCTAPRRPRRR